MNPILVVGLGNPLMGDDGVGERVADLLSRHRGLPRGIDVVRGGSDVLRLARLMEGRDHVTIVDAVLTGDPVGTVLVLSEEQRADVGMVVPLAHTLPVIQSIRLLKLTTPELERTRFTVLGVAVERAARTAQLSPHLEVHLPDIVDRVAAELRRLARPTAPRPPVRR